ncbi:hypothetical protein ACLOJK_008334 [Asimina triloba]
MALVVGNLALLIDPTNSSRISFHTRPSPVDLVSLLPNKLRDPIPLTHTTSTSPSPSPSTSTSTSTSCPSPLDCLDAVVDGRTHRMGSRRRPNSKANAYDFGTSNGNNSNGDEEDNGNGYDDWEEEMRNKAKEIEEMKELEKKAEELQSRVAADQGEGGVEETEEEKKERVRRELEKVAREQAERRETAKLMFDLGQKAYGRGMYGRAIEFLEGALTIIPKPTVFGGEIQIWLAMAYEANNRHKDCIALYQELENKHPSVSIRRQAANLRYILQAPKLKISEDEMVRIPMIGSSYDSPSIDPLGPH